MKVHKLINSTRPNKHYKLRAYLNGDQLKLEELVQETPITGIQQEVTETTEPPQPAWVVFDTVVVNLSELIANQPDHTIISICRGGAVINSYARTYPSRLRFSDFARTSGLQAMAHVALPFANTSLAHCAVGIVGLTDELVELHGDFPQPGVELDGFDDFSVLYMPTVSIGEPVQAGTTVSFPVEVSSPSDIPAQEATLFIETTLGSTVAQRVATTNLTGTAMISIVDVPQGYQGKIKVGFKNFASKAEKEFVAL